MLTYSLARNMEKELRWRCENVCLPVEHTKPNFSWILEPSVKPSVEFGREFSSILLNCEFFNRNLIIVFFTAGVWAMDISSPPNEYLVVDWASLLAFWCSFAWRPSEFSFQYYSREFFFDLSVPILKIDSAGTGVFVFFLLEMMICFFLFFPF